MSDADLIHAARAGSRAISLLSVLSEDLSAVWDHLRAGRRSEATETIGAMIDRICTERMAIAEWSTEERLIRELDRLVSAYEKEAGRGECFRWTIMLPTPTPFLDDK